MPREAGVITAAAGSYSAGGRERAGCCIPRSARISIQHFQPVNLSLTQRRHERREERVLIVRHLSREMIEHGLQGRGVACHAA